MARMRMRLGVAFGVMLGIATVFGPASGANLSLRTTSARYTVSKQRFQAKGRAVAGTVVRLEDATTGVHLATAHDW